jgi:aryl-alcohol dehydrogenase-like predicted oxidoreductase
MMYLETRKFGRTGRMVTRVGLGGEGILRTQGRSREALSVIQEAQTQGIGYWDSARAYEGSEGYYGAFWKDHGELRRQVFQTSKSAHRDGKGALADLQQSLSLLNTSTLDLWQIHDLRTREEVAEMEKRGGALEVFIEAKEKGRVDAIGVTGHHDPEVLTQVIETWPLDTVLLPVNPVEGVIGGFLDCTIPAARRRGLGIVGMKVLGAGQYIDTEAGISPQLLIRYALSQDVDVVITGCSHPQEVRNLAQAARSPLLSGKDQAQLLDQFRPDAEMMAFYRGVL